MRRALLASLLLLAAFPASAGAANVKLLACVPALEGADRSATFEARVRPQRDSERMQLRFTLQVRESGDEGWRRVVAPGFDEWLTSDPGVTRYSYTRTVENLPAPATYRTVVRFRWLDAAGAVLDRSRATSKPCRQPDVRPDLVATRIELSRPLFGGQARYFVTLRNGGRTAAGPFSVALRAGDQEPATVAVEGLDADAREVVTFAGPACVPGEPLAVTVDPEQAVDERDEEDNVLQALCPA